MASTSGALNLVKQNKCFGGILKKFKHASTSCKSEMTFSVFLPACAEQRKVPVVFFLSGLTCTDENFVTKAGAQRSASELGLALVVPDTSPRGCNIDGDKASWDFGEGAGFYVNATQAKWSTNYNMYSYVTRELPQVVSALPGLDLSRRSIFGHSMGGHGALICALKNPGMFRSCSAFSPICHPSACPWGQKAFAGYLGDDKSEWAAYDATELAKAYTGPSVPILCDTGLADEFYEKKQLLPEDLLLSAKGNPKIELDMRFHAGYDHSYYFIASFVDEHLRFHAKHLL
jgi:S-formylglutathione hydrolase